MKWTSASLVVAAAMSAPFTAHAADKRPRAEFPDASPEAVTRTIMEACVERGFIIRSKGPSSVVCQATEIPNKKDGGFRPKVDTTKTYFMTFEFVATPSPSGSLVTASTTMVLSIEGGAPVRLDGSSGFRFHAQIREFLAGLGGSVTQ